MLNFISQKCYSRGAWLAQLEEHVTLNLGVVSSSPTLGIEITKKIKLKKKVLFKIRHFKTKYIISLWTHQLDKNKLKKAFEKPTGMCQVIYVLYQFRKQKGIVKSTSFPFLQVAAFN